MKNFTRALVAVLTLTGSVAYTQIDNGAHKVVASKTSCMPMPLCPPGDPNGCGIGSNR